ncbi:hypothetical protein CPB86DRAFT_868523 [Serendipita vermifera]|nr:hypothetical protein CPB86DRAFT_868523 [Serendipita vermifera]
MARVTLTEDIVLEILEHAWVLHSKGWDVEFRPEAFRRFFIRYALISRIWTIPAERYIYRSCFLEWDYQKKSFEAGINNRIRGQALGEFVRVMDISLSHKKLGIPVESLDKVLRCCPNLVELRLGIGPEVNTLFRKSTTEKHLREVFTSLATSLRAIQLFLVPHPSKTKVLEELQSLICFTNLDFLVVASKDGEIRPPSFDPSEWSTCNISGTYVTWPIETNSAHSSSSSIKPETLRLNTDDALSHPLFGILGQEIKRVLYRGYSRRWDEYLTAVIEDCQNLEQLLVIYPGRSSHADGWLPTLRLYVVERQDWSISPAIQENEPAGPSSRVNAKDSIEIQSMSHIVGFHHGFPPSWKYEGSIQPRKRTIFDPRTAREAFFGTDVDLLQNSPIQFVQSTDYYEDLFVAFRKRHMNPEAPDPENS